MRTMLELCADAATADKQMQAVIFYLTTFGHIDGDFDPAEKDFVRRYIAGLVEHRAGPGMAEAAARDTARFLQMFDAIDRQVKDLFDEAVTYYENSDQFVHFRLKVRCYEIFKQFDKAGQEQLLAALDELLMADGEAHPAEVRFRAELARLLDAEEKIELADHLAPRATRIAPGKVMESKQAVHPFFVRLEHDYAVDPETMRRQIEGDRQAMRRTRQLLDGLRAQGAGKLAGKKDVAELAPTDLLLDDHVWLLGPQAGRRYELTVLGDLHGCYSCLKAAVIQSGFLEKVELYRKDPQAHPFPQLVFLGDYIDRGIFSLNGVLRTVLQLFCAWPDHVIVLRGNHEYYVEHEGGVHGGVKPSEAIEDLKKRASLDVIRDYMRFFETLPVLYLFGRVCFVHGGVPRDRTFRDRYKDLGSLNDPELRFQMMWGDPSPTDVIPASLQDHCSRFSFGRLQSLRFLRRIGCDTLIRGHERVNEGFRINYDDPDQILLTLFSSGGKSNGDLPTGSSYRYVEPMALTLEHEDGQTLVTPWPIDYEPYNDPERNAFFRAVAKSYG
jgi:hypothetical protein